MLVETDNLVAKDEFRENLDRFIEAAQAGHGPVAVTADSQVVVFFISRDDYEAMFGAAVRELLTERSHGETVDHATATQRVLRAARGFSNLIGSAEKANRP